MGAFLNKVVEFADRHARTINVISIAWFIISCASWIPFMGIPEIPYITDRNFWISSAVWNFAWWGFAFPIITEHRKKMKAAAKQDALADESRD